ncbi:MAG: ComF family protein [Kiritimatiellia bacterium]
MDPAPKPGGGFIKLSGAILDLVYPRTCLGCAQVVDAAQGHLCHDCIAGNLFITLPYCDICGFPVSGRIDHAYTCNQCVEHPPQFDLARSAVRYEGVLREAIHAFKYQQAIWLQEDLGDFLEAVYNTQWEPGQFDAVIPVPLHPRRRRHRGFNQAALLGQSLSKRINTPIILKKLTRIRYTASQTRLTKAGRLQNLKGAFQVHAADDFNGVRRVLLVDDVMTTGATISECARALKQAGVEQVVALTLARG